MRTEQLSPDERRTTERVRDVLLAGEDVFRPFAVFDEQLDCIRVVTRDCSWKEVRIGDVLTVLEANYPGVEGQSEIVGFTIKGVAHLCETYGIRPDVPWLLADFLNALVNSAPRERVVVNRIVRPLVAETNIRVVERPKAA